MINKIKIKPKPHLPAKPLPKPSYWYCEICEKKYAKKGKYQHLKTDTHKRNEGKIGPAVQRITKKSEDYVENRLKKLIKQKILNESFVGGTLLDDPIIENSAEPPLQAPANPSTSAEPPVPKKKIRRIKALPRRQTPAEQAPATPAKPATEPASLPKRLQEKVKNLFNEIIPYYIPEPIKRLKFIPEAISNFTTKIIPKAISNFFFPEAKAEPEAISIPEPEAISIPERSKALRGNVQSYDVPIVNSYDPSIQLCSTKRAIFDLLMGKLKDKRGFKYNTTLRVRLSKLTENEPIYREPYFNAGPFTVTNRVDIEESIDNGIERILELIAVWLSEGSGWVFESVLLHIINIVSYFPLRGTSYIELPKELCHPKKTLVNPKNKDNRCFLWCHIRHLNPQKKDPQRIKISDREYVKRLDYTGVTFPVTLSDIKRIEKQNEINVSVFGYKSPDSKGRGGTYPIRLSEANFTDHMELLLIDDQNGNSHYVLIKNFDQFMSSFTKHHGRKYFCLRCLHCCSSERTYKIHREDCLLLNGAQKIRMPGEGSKIYFKNHKKMLPAPFVIYADFEAITEKIDSCVPPDGKSYTSTYQSHKACAYGYKLVCRYDNKYSKPVEIYRGGDAIDKFIVQMMNEVKDCKRIVREHFQKPLVMTFGNKRDFQNATKCHICEKIFEPEDLLILDNGVIKNKVRDHCHITGKYRGAAHRDCNLEWAISAENLKIPVVFHNLKGYDCHFIMQKLGKLINEDVVYDIVKFKDENGNIQESKRSPKISVIASTFEKYMGFRLGNHLTFIDSFSFMSQSLDRLSSNLSNLFYTREAFPNDEQFRLIKRKGVYPYDYMDSFKRFSEKSLPRREDFYSILNDSGISESDHSHAKEVWSTFQIRDMGEYHDLYLRTDVLLLADVFESFRSTCLEYYRLDPCHYYSAPGLSWDALLRMTKINLDLIADLDQQLFIEKGMRGGISTITHRHAVANNKYMKDYNPDEASTYLMYLDANNLYGWAMSQSLPTGDFKWIPSEDFEDPEDFILENYTNDTRKGVVLEVDLEYPEELHDLHNDYPLAPEKILITDDMLSKYCKDLKDSENISSGRVHKLVPNLRNKEKYVLHYRNLQLYLSLGMKLKKIHRVLEFTQRPWMKRYIDFNTEKRTMAKNSFEKDFFKLMNNSVFGKTMENLRKRSNIKLETDQEHFLKLTRQPTYVSSKIFDENLVGVQMKKACLFLDKPSYVGFSILDMSKTLMYEFHYNYIRKKYPDAKLLFTDTDSLFYHIKAEDIYSDFYKDKDLFDNSDYPKSSKFHFAENKKVIGKFKDETAGDTITEFVGLKSKMYSYKTENKENKTAKGVKKNVINSELSLSDYLNTLQKCNTMRHKMRTIRSEHHQISSYQINKVSLSPFDDKRYILDDGISSYAYWNHKINNNL